MARIVRVMAMAMLMAMATFQLVARPAAAQNLVCASPCADGYVAPVCNPVDGFVYMNPCLAACAGITKLSDTACYGDAALKTSYWAPKGLPRSGKTGQLNSDMTKMFANERFKLVGVVSFATVGMNETTSLPIVTGDEVKRIADGVDKGAPKLRSGFRVSYDGLLYRISEADLQALGAPFATQFPAGDSDIKLIAPADNTGRCLTTGDMPCAGANSKPNCLEGPLNRTATRKLRYVFSPDGRTNIAGSMSNYPWRTIGQIDMVSSTGGRFGCSGATVGTRSVLTAGHCVHQGPGGNWYDVKFSAGRTCTTSSACNPYGTLSWSYMTTYTAWTNSRDWRFDIAVIRFSTNIGSTVGHMGLTNTRQYGYLNTAGYPGDKTSGTPWFNSDILNDGDTSNKLMYTSSIDIIPGQSGSPTWELRSDGGRYIKGVVSHHWCPTSSVSGGSCASSSGYNGFVQFDRTHFNNILAWR